MRSEEPRSDLRIVAQTVGGGFFVVAADHYLGLYTLGRSYDARRDRLSDELWLGSLAKHLGAYLEDPALDPDEERRILARVGELLGDDQTPLY